MELKVLEKIRRKIRKKIQTTPIEVTTSTSDVGDEKQFFFAQADAEDETEEQTLEEKEQSRKIETEWVANEQPSSLKPTIREFTRIDGNSTSYSIIAIEAFACIRVEQDVDLVVNNFRPKIIRQPHDEVLVTTDSRFRH